jgi:hypothetical protein
MYSRQKHINKNTKIIKTVLEILHVYWLYLYVKIEASERLQFLNVHYC